MSGEEDYVSDQRNRVLVFTRACGLCVAVSRSPNVFLHSTGLGELHAIVCLATAGRSHTKNKIYFSILDSHALCVYLERTRYSDARRPLDRYKCIAILRRLDLQPRHRELIRIIT